jgi:hypothetical protein
MSTHANQANCSPNRCSTVRDIVEFLLRVNIGGTGAPTIPVNGSDDPAITVTRTGAGTYDLTFPKGKRVFIGCTIKSYAATVVGWRLNAFDANAGTATIKTMAGTNAAVDTDPASGDALFVSIKVER